MNSEDSAPDALDAATDAPGQEPHDQQELRRTVRDLVAISTLPAVWVGKGAAAIAESLADLLVSTLGLEMIYIRTQGSRADEPIEIARRRGRPFPPSRVAALGQALAPWLESGAPPTGRGIVNPVGSGTIYPAVARFGRGDSRGAIFAGSTHPGFPTERDRLLLSVGANHMVVMQQRDRAEAGLRESEARFRRLADSAPVMIWVSEPDGAVSFQSEQWYRFTGQAAGAALGDGWLDCVHPADRVLIEQRWRDANRAIADTREEYRLRRADGEYRWVLDSATPRYGEQGEFLGFIGSVVDIHDRRLAEQKLGESERRYAMVTELVPQLIWTTGPQGEREYFNKRWLDFTGMTKERLDAGETPLHPDDADRVRTAWARAVKDGQPFEMEYRLRNTAGGYEWFLVQALPDYDAKGRIVRWYGTCTNIDAQRRSRQR